VTTLRMALIVAAAMYGVLIAVTFLFSDRMILPAPASSYGNPDADMKVFRGADGAALIGLFLPLPEARYTVLYSHGNFEDLGWVRARMEILRGLGLQVFGYDYRGYGLSEGTASVARATEDARAAFAHVRDTLGVPSERIVLYGRSVGGGPSLRLALEEPVAGVILEATFTSAFRVVTQVPLLPFDRFPNASLIGQLDAPVLLLHGRHDRVVPFRHGPALLAAATEPKRAVWFDDAGHNDIVETAPERYRTALRSFIAELDAAPPGTGAPVAGPAGADEALRDRSP
jgi:fermentation-respiration switch protein FrsA (DUF1100 family)